MNVIVWALVFNSVCLVAVVFAWMWHARGERRALQDISKEAMHALLARNPREAAEGRALENWEAEMVRQQKLAFDQHQRKPQTEEPRPVAKAVDAKGNVFEIVAGME